MLALNGHLLLLRRDCLPFQGTSNPQDLQDSAGNSQSTMIKKKPPLSQLRLVSSESEAGNMQNL